MSVQAPLLTPEHIAMIDKGVSAIVASRSAANRPSLMRAVGASISPDGADVTVYLSRTQSRQLLQDVAATGEVAVVFSEPLSHRTVQVKAQAAQLRPAGDADLPLLRRYLASMEHEVGCVGFDAPFVRAMLACPLEDMMAVSFRPSQAFDQTPGPRAGSPLPAR
ncbi:pyridoxamine 5'-phosphate oxidase family protein [Variovorax sp. KK3]|uniref:pyridoxamine 5'-phosphate oxidase family protein n=1 Tax=Variovorax sp. KK3 TaxID=1855728 RepID=UPI00097C006A|nr:pyridoxamine 5'-phosphate oxidase family protein [Variovorax sp. KK3]